VFFAALSQKCFSKCGFKSPGMEIF